MIDKWGIKQEQAEVLLELEKIIGTSIPDVDLKIYDSWSEYIVGVKIDYGDVIGLRINSHQLTKFPESIGDLKSLELLYLNDNKLTTLPESIGNLKSLKHLGLNDNKLTTLPESIGNLKSLQYLELKDNKLTALPESIGNLSSLWSLDLRNNLLKQLPNTFESIFQKDVKVGLDGNLFLNFKAIPQLFSKKENERECINLQRINFVKMINNSQIKDYYWNCVLNEILDYRRRYGKMLEPKWTFELIRIEDPESLELYRGSNLYMNSISTHNWFFSSDQKLLHLGHPNRKENFLKLLLVIFPALNKEEIFTRSLKAPAFGLFGKIPEFEIIKFLFPLIKSITITIETDRGDYIPTVFTDFYFKKYQISTKLLPYYPFKTLELFYNAWREGGVLYFGEYPFVSTAFIKFDPAYKMEPYAKLKFVDINVEYEERLLPKEDVDFNILLKKLVNYISSTDQESEKQVKSIKKLSSNILSNEKYKEVNKLIDKFKSDGWQEPVIPDVILKIGNTFLGRFGRFLEYVMAGIVFLTALPSLIQFILKLFYPIEEIPIWLEILSYSPLIIGIIVAIFVFLKKHSKVPKFTR